MTLLLRTLMFASANEMKIGARETLTDGVFTVYLRIGTKVQLPDLVFLHIADVRVEEGHRGRGIFTRYLDALEQLRPLDGIAFYGVGNTRLEAHLVRRGYELYDWNDYVKIWK